MDTCTHDGCEREAHAKGLCHRHYRWARRRGLIPGPTCVVAECGRPADYRGLCGMHAHRRDRHGNPATRVKAGNGEVKSMSCCVVGCSRAGCATHQGAVYCNVHIYRVKTHGDPNTVKKLGNGHSTPEREKSLAADRQRRYLATPTGMMRHKFNAAKRRARKYGIDTATGLTRDQLESLYHRETCAVCGLLMPAGDRTIDHIVPLSRGGANTFGNLQTAHGVCNSRKKNRLYSALPSGPVLL